ncbi:MAG: hypothetical protein AAGB48_05885 [Planctomycetota bacterium]
MNETPAATSIAPGERARCPYCDYSLAGIESITCPECGKVLTPEGCASDRPRRLEIAAVAGLLVSGALFSATGVGVLLGLPMMIGGIAIALSPLRLSAEYRRLLLIAALASWCLLVVGIGTVVFVLLRGEVLLP